MAIINFPDTTGQPTDGSFTYTFEGVLYSWTGTYWAANSQSGYDSRYVEVDGDTMTGDLTVPSLNGGPLAGFRNLLINGDFRIWQRGTAALTDANAFYGADRWVSGNSNTISRSGTSAVGFTYSARITYSGSATEGYVGQPIELTKSDNQSPVNPGTYTLSWYTNVSTTTAIMRWRITGTSATGQINGAAFSAPVAIGSADANGFTRYQSQITVPTSTLTGGVTSCYVAIRSTDADFRVAGVQLEPGPVATPFEHRPISVELALCQRFYQTRSSGTVNAADLRPTMRATPTVSGNNYDAEL